MNMNMIFAQQMLQKGQMPPNLTPQQQVKWTKCHDFLRHTVEEGRKE